MPIAEPNARLPVAETFLRVPRFSVRSAPSGYLLVTSAAPPSKAGSLEGTKTDHGEEDAGRVVPVPATLAWMLEAQINLSGSDCNLLFPTPRSRMWRERTSTAMSGGRPRKLPG